MMMVLVIAPAGESRQTLCRQLEDVGYQTLEAGDGSEGLALARQQQPDLVIVERELPGLDGFGVCRMLRFTSDVPILILSAHQDVALRVQGLDLGADDYLIRPCEMMELLARVRALLRRGIRPLQVRRSSVLLARDLRLDLGRRRAFRSGAELSLSQKEFDLLTCLMRNTGMVLPRPLLLQEVWGNATEGTSRTVDVHVRWLRTKIEPEPARPAYIETVHGHGYRFAVPVTTHMTGTEEAFLALSNTQDSGTIS